MSREENNSNSKKIITVTNESLNKKEDNPVRTSQSMNTESYEYFSQKITTKNNITESSSQKKNQNTNKKELKCICNQEIKEVKSQPKCTCNQNLISQKKEIKCTCNISSGNNLKCTCGLSHNISGGKTLINKVNISTKTTTTKYNNGSNTQKITTQKTTTKTTQINNVKNSSNINTQSKTCNCEINKGSSIQQENKTKIETSKIKLNMGQMTKEQWNKKCVGQNNENIQILAAEKPELLIQCVQDIKVIQEPKPVQVLMPIVPNEIDYPLGLEIYGKEKKVLICPENVENLNVSKAYSKIEHEFEDLNIDQNEKVYCERKPNKVKKVKKEKYDKELEIENGEMFVKGEKVFNKSNEMELTTKMNVAGKQKLQWNETNEAIKTTKMNVERLPTKFKNLYEENNTYNYKGQIKTKYGPTEVDLYSNGQLEYPAEYITPDWNKDSMPMSGRPFTLDKTKKQFNLSTKKETKITLKKEYETKDWNKEITKKKVNEINMVKKQKKRNLEKQKIKPIQVEGYNWNDLIIQQKDADILLKKMENKQNDFVLSRGDEVHISNEPEEILVNDDYNIIEENYTRSIRANIKKIQEFSEESVSSEYDVLKGIQKYMGEYRYKDLVNESVKIEGQQVIINDISGKYPRRVESFHGLDENFQKLTNDQIEQKKSERNFNMQIQKQVITTTKYQQGYEQVNQYQYEHEIEQESSLNNNNEPEDGQELEHEQEEQENMDVPEDKDHVPEFPQDHNEHSQEIDNNEQEMEEQENIKRNEQYIYLKQNEEKVDGKPKDEHEPEDEVKDTNQKKEKSSEENSPKIYIKEITYTKNEHNRPLVEETNLRYITLKKKDEMEDSHSQPNDDNEEEEIIEKKEVNIKEKYITMESQKVEEQHISKSENDIKSDLDKEVEKKEENQYLTMESQKVEEQHISKDEGEPDNELDEEIKKKEVKIELENHKLDIPENEQEGQGEIKGNQGEEYLEENGEENNEEHAEEQGEGHFEQEEGEHEEEYAEEHVEEQGVEYEEEHEEENQEEHVEEQQGELVEDQQEEPIEDQEEYVEDQQQEPIDEQQGEHIEAQEEEQIEPQQEEHVEEHQEENVEAQQEEHAEAQEEENIEAQHGELVESLQEEHVEEHQEEIVEAQQEEQQEEHIEAQEEEHIEPQQEEHVEEHQEENVEAQQEEHAEEQHGELVESQQEENAEEQQENQKVEQNDEPKVEQKEEENVAQEQNQEIHEEEQKQGLGKQNIQINVTETKTKSLSHIVADAIKTEMENQESKVIKDGHQRGIPSDNYSKSSYKKKNIEFSQGNGQNIVKKVIQKQTVETTVTINPMMYSFGQASIEGSHSNGENKNIQNINTNIATSNITFGQDGGLTTTQYLSKSGIGIDMNTKQQIPKVESVYMTQSNKNNSNLGMSGKYYFTKNYSSRTYSYAYRSDKEPMDTVKARKLKEREMKASNEIDDLIVGPRDSRRKDNF